MHPIQKAVGLFAALVAFCVVYPSPATGQSAAQVRGTVADQSGASIPAATVTLFSDDRVRTAKTDSHGGFIFSSLPGPARFLEASAVGFRAWSVAAGDKLADELLITLVVGSCPPDCTVVTDPPDDRARPSVHYKDKSGPEQLSGTAGEYRGTPLAHVSLVLMKADLSDPQVSAPLGNRNPPMDRRTFRYSFAAETMSDEEGKFHFGGLEPGWYSLETNYAGYQAERRNFWIAHENLTRPSPIEMLRTSNNSTKQPIREVPILTDPR